MWGQSDAGSAGIFSRRTNQTQEIRVFSASIFARRTNRTQETRVYSHAGPIRRRKCGHILTCAVFAALGRRSYSPPARHRRDNSNLRG
eukprot:1176855-Prorocentrum_minimum.AAC.2